MPMNRMHFQRAMSLPELVERYGTDEQCIAVLCTLRCLRSSRCPRCACAAIWMVRHGVRGLFRCKACRHHSSLTTGVFLDRIELPLHTWFLTPCLVSQDNTGLSSLALTRQLGATYRTACLIHQKLIATMAEHDGRQPLYGSVHLDDAYLAGEQPGMAGPGFAHDAIARGAKPRSNRRSDTLSCFPGVIDAAFTHPQIAKSARKPRDLPLFTSVNIVLGNMKTTDNGAYNPIKFRKYAGKAALNASTNLKITIHPPTQLPLSLNGSTA